MSDDYTRDPAASAPLSELADALEAGHHGVPEGDPDYCADGNCGDNWPCVPTRAANALRVAQNIAGDIEAVADELDAEFDFVPTDACYRLQDAATRLRRIAAGIRENVIKKGKEYK